MKILITGICGFVGSELAHSLMAHSEGLEITGIDNFSRNGSWLNRDGLLSKGVKIIHGDIRNAADLEALGPFDWVIDAAANPSVLAGIDGKSSSRQLVENNLGGTINLLEACKSWQAGFILLSTSRVYSIPPLASLEVEVRNHAYHPIFRNTAESGKLKAETARNQAQGTNNEELPGLSPAGVSEQFSTAPPVSLYGSTKLTSESLALEYGHTFDFPVWINRCGVMAGARQFGKPDQGIFAFWIHSWREGQRLKYIGFDGLGHQVRDCLHPRDLAPLVLKQMGKQKVESRNPQGEDSCSFQLSKYQLSALPQVVNLSGGIDSATSLRQLTDWCADRFPDSPTGKSLPRSCDDIEGELPVRPFDLPWVVLDHQLAQESWDWKPQTSVETILEEIAQFADDTPDWIATSA